MAPPKLSTTVLLMKAQSCRQTARHHQTCSHQATVLTTCIRPARAVYALRLLVYRVYALAHNQYTLGHAGIST